MASAAAFHSNLSATPIAAQKSCSGVHGPRCPLSARRSVTAAVLSLIARPIIAPASERVLSGQSGTGLQKRFRLQAMALPTDQPVKVLVTGAGGRTGKLVLKKLLAQPDRFTAKGLVHSVPSLQTVQQETGISKESSFVADIAASSSDIARALQDTDALIIATSAVPKMAKEQKESGPPHMYYEQMPEQVDWIGQKNQIDAAVKAGVKKIVLVSSMGGTDPSNRLNQIGNGNILLFKRKAEEYLMAQGIDYTIIHPGGLIDEQGGEREIVVGVDDELMKRESRSIPRADVAELCIQSLLLPAATNRSFDAISNKPPGSTDFSTLLDNMSANCNYSLGATA